MGYPEYPVNLSNKYILSSFLDSFDSMPMIVTDDDMPLSAGAIAGIVVGAVVIMIIMLVVSIYCCCRINPL